VEQPAPRFFLFQKFNILQGISARNKLIEELTAAEANEVLCAVKAKLKALADGQLLIDTPTKFDPKVAAVQVFNPTVGKGINRVKSDSAARGPLPGAFTDWFEEWLRFIGSDMIMAGYSLGEDIKMTVPIPARAGFRHLYRLTKLQTTPAWTSRKSDLYAVFDLIGFLLEKSDQQSESGWSYGIDRGSSPRDVFSTIQTAYFKSLGSAKPVSNISSIGLPNWFPVHDEEDIFRWKRMVEEHRKIVQLLDEDKSEEAELLHLYRDFLSASDWYTFLHFLGGYGCLIMGRRERKKPIRSFHRANLEELLRVADLKITEVLKNQGFRNIAKAMKQATVSEQYQKSKGNQVFEIKYGLFQELKRKAKFREELLTVISEFISEFNYENARREEQLKDKPGRRRKRVSMEDMEQFADLLDKYSEKKHTEAIGMLLIAFASCKEEAAREEFQDYTEEEVEV
jgi:hypothetical protein